MTRKQICLVSHSHLASNPRLVKEADALHEAGFGVKVIAGDAPLEANHLDSAILGRAPWMVVKVGLAVRSLHFVKRLRQEFSKQAYRAGMRTIQAAVWAQSPVTGGLAKAAAAERADLYIAHYLPALPAVAWAARCHGAMIGFDAEDDHVGELYDTPEDRCEIDIRQRIEAHFLPRCKHLTAASPGIAHAYNKRYGVSMSPILNVFPLSEAPAAPHARRARGPGEALSVYWFSQTIGPGRGLEAFIQSMGKMRGITLSIRGNDFLGYSSRLKTLAAEVGAGNALYFLPPAPPDEMVRLAARHDIGLAFELCTPPNRAISLPNKIFTYLLAGIPVLLSNTPAQRELAGELGRAGYVVDWDDSDSITDTLVSLALNNNKALVSAKGEAWRLGQTRFNWDIEKKTFLHGIESAFRDKELPNCHQASVI